jgi:hypothetical protein
MCVCTTKLYETVRDLLYIPPHHRGPFQRASTERSLEIGIENATVHAKKILPALEDHPNRCVVNRFGVSLPSRWDSGSDLRSPVFFNQLRFSGAAEKVAC